ncbi:MAG: SulP family inorganic anion transporter [Deltaproteobacteria bacterium]|nr:SulP family inorganic anion transporter [Deltaproteobacteria bacterium]
MSDHPNLRLAGALPASSPAPRRSSRFHISYTSEDLRKDLLAGLTVGAISLPQGMAYALLAGVDPRFGLYSAIVVTAVASIFGASSHLINGPTSAISLVVFGALAFFDPEQKIEAAEAMFLLGAMVGAIQIFIAVFRLGDLTRYISESVILGFMTAAAGLLALGQLGNTLGVRDQGTRADHILYRLWLTLAKGDPINYQALAIAAATLVLAIALRKLVRRYRLPQFDMLGALVAVGVIAYLAGWTRLGFSGKTLIPVSGAVPATLPAPHIPQVKLIWAKDLASSALAIAFLGLLEALAIAKSIANQTQQKFDFNQQCLAEGLANLAGGFFRCLPGSGSLSRSAINFQAGAVTRFSGIITAAAVAVAVLLLAPLARFVPKSALAALLLITAARLIEPTRILYTIRASGADAWVFAITAVSAIVLGLDESILIGVGLSVILFVPRAARLKATELIVDGQGVVRDRRPEDAPCTAFILYDFEGELFFGAGPELDRYFSGLIDQVHRKGMGHIVLRVKRLRNPDVVCLEHLEHFLRKAEREGITVLIAGLRPDLIAAMRRLRFSVWLSDDRLFPQGNDEDSATLAAIRSVYQRLGGSNTCEHCGSDQASHARNRLYYLV